MGEVANRTRRASAEGGDHPGPRVRGIPNTPRTPGTPSIARIPGIPNTPRTPGTPSIARIPGIPNTPGISRISRWVLRIVGAVSAGLLSSSLWLIVPSLSCPPPTRALGLRALSVQMLLASTSDGRSVLRRLASRPRICFASVSHGVLYQNGVFVLAAGEPIIANASRLAHLLLHAIEGPPLDEIEAQSGATPCETLIHHAMMAERRAHAMEQRVRRVLGAMPSDAGWHATAHVGAMPSDAGSYVAADAEELADVESQYMQRCQALRRTPLSTGPRPPDFEKAGHFAPATEPTSTER